MDDTQENPMLRFKAFWLTLGLMLLFALAGFAFRAASAPGEELDAGAELQRLATLSELRKAEKSAVEATGLTYHDTEGGHLTRVSVPDAIIEKALAKLKSQPARKTELLIPGSKTFLEKQAGTHDPAESAFLTQ
jgi:hypothetical protein